MGVDARVWHDRFRRLSHRLGQDYLHRKILRVSASAEPTEQLLTREPIEAETPEASVPSETRPSSPDDFSLGSTFFEVVEESNEFLDQSDRATAADTNENSSRESTAIESSGVLPTVNTLSSSQAEGFVSRRQSSTTDLDPDMTASQNADERSESRLSASSTAVASVDYHGRPMTCYMCGKFFGNGEDQTKEKLAYLPCGHCFGHECLFRWLSKPNGVRRCPLMPCINVRHQCEHCTLPMEKPPSRTFLDRDAAVIPWDYEFCQSDKGVKMHNTIKKLSSKLRKATAPKTTKRGSSTSSFSLDLKPKYFSYALAQAEKKLDDLQKNWWTYKWLFFGKGLYRDVQQQRELSMASDLGS